MVMLSLCAGAVLASESASESERVDVLCEILLSKKRKVAERVDAATELRHIGDAKGVRSLCLATADPSEEVRDAVVWALWELTEKAPQNSPLRAATHRSLVRLIYDPQEAAEVRARAISALGGLGIGGAGDKILRAADDGNAEVREAALAALKGSKVPGLLRSALAHLADDSRGVAAAASSIVASRLPAAKVAEIGRNWLADDQWQKRRAAVLLLGEAPVAGASALLRKALGDARQEVVVAAILSLRAVDAKNAIPVIGQMVRDEREEVAVVAALALGGLRGGAEVPFLLEAATDRRTRVAWTAIARLGGLGDRRAIKTLLKSLQRPEPMVCGTAAWALGAVGHKGAANALVQALERQDGNVERRGSHWYAVDARWRKAAGVQLVGLQQAAVHALGELRSKEAAQPIVHLLRKSKYYNIRAACADALGSIRDPTTRPDLVKVRDSDPVHWVRLRARLAVVSINLSYAP